MGTIKFYFDEMVSRVAANQLLQREIAVTLAADVEMVGKDDDTEHLPYASQNEMVLVTFDRPFAGRTMQRTDHAGLICLTCRQDDIGSIVKQLSQFAEQHTSASARGRVFWR